MAKKKIKLNIGCGIRVVPGFINVDKMFTKKELLEKKGVFKNSSMTEDIEYIQADARSLPFKDNYADYVESVDMIEHIPMREVAKVLSEIHRVLKKGGEFRIMTTNFDELARLWTEYVTNKEMDFTDPNCHFFDLAEVIYGNQHHGGEFHVSAFNPRYMNALLKYVGFSDIVINIYPTGCADSPNMETAPWEKDMVARTEMMVAHAKK